MNIKRLISILLVLCILLALATAFISCKDDDEDDYDPDKNNGGENNGDENGGDENGGANEDGGETDKSGWPDTLLTYEQYRDLGWQEQEAYYYTFATPKDFRDWFNQAKKEYEDAQDREEISGDGEVDLGGE